MPALLLCIYSWTELKIVQLFLKSLRLMAERFFVFAINSYPFLSLLLCVKIFFSTFWVWSQVYDLWSKSTSVNKYFLVLAAHLFTSYNLYNSSQYEFYCVLNDKRLCCENKPENSCLSASWKQQFSALCLVPQQKTLHLKVSKLIRLYKQKCFGTNIICPRFCL